MELFAPKGRTTSPRRAQGGVLALILSRLALAQANILRKQGFFPMVRGMNSPEPELGPAKMAPTLETPVESGAQTMAALREEIDAIDGELACLITKRSGLAHAIAQAKLSSGDKGFGWRPAREVEILRSILEREPDLDAHLAATIWRALIAANLAAQGGLEIFTTLEAAPWARLAFSTSGQTHIAKTDHALLKALTQGERRIGCLAWPDEAQTWWRDMMSAAYTDLYVCAASPPVRGQSAPEALLVARRLPEASGDDITLLAGSSADLNMEGGQIICTIEDLSLMQVPRFISADVLLPSGIRRIGCFALA
jgi:chorismate mutase